LPLQFAFEAGLSPELFEAICRQGLEGYGVDVNAIATIPMNQLDPHRRGLARSGIRREVLNCTLDADSFFRLPLDQLIGEILRKINFLLHQPAIDHHHGAEDCVNQLNVIRANLLLLGDYLRNPPRENLDLLFHNWQELNF
jgi:hypothetical protein